jgi:hypothetical protein
VNDDAISTRSGSVRNPKQKTGYPDLPYPKAIERRREENVEQRGSPNRQNQRRNEVVVHGQQDNDNQEAEACAAQWQVQFKTGSSNGPQRDTAPNARERQIP